MKIIVCGRAGRLDVVETRGDKIPRVVGRELYQRQATATHWNSEKRVTVIECSDDRGRYWYKITSTP